MNSPSILPSSIKIALLSIKKRVKSLTQQGSSAIIYLLQKRNRWFSGRSFIGKLIEVYLMNYPVVKGISNPHFFTIKEAASVFGISVSTLEREIKAGLKPPKIKITNTHDPNKRGRVGLLVADVQNWFEGKRENWFCSAA